MKYIIHKIWNIQLLMSQIYDIMIYTPHIVGNVLHYHFAITTIIVIIILKCTAYSGNNICMQAVNMVNKFYIRHDI